MTGPALSVDMESQQINKLGIAKERPYGVVLFSVVVRALHLVGSGVFLACFLVDEPAGPPALYLWLAGITGAVLMVTEGLRHRQFYREFAGVGTFVKLLLLGLAFHNLLPQAATVLAAFMVAAIAAHLPKNIRHRLLY